MVSLYKPSIWGQAGISSRSAINSTFSCRLTLTCSSRSCFYSAQLRAGLSSGQQYRLPSLRVWANSATVAYGLNRADWSYIPGGVISGLP